MTPDTVIDIGQQALQLTTMILGVLLLPALAVGLLISLFQAATQINEMTLSFIPKLLVTFLVLALAGPWILDVLLGFMTRLMADIPQLIG
jgi:flagellar biosynthetic protein FliQ